MIGRNHIFISDGGTIKYTLIVTHEAWSQDRTIELSGYGSVKLQRRGKLAE